MAGRVPQERYRDLGAAALVHVRASIPEGRAQLKDVLPFPIWRSGDVKGSAIALLLEGAPRVRCDLRPLLLSSASWLFPPLSELNAGSSMARQSLDFW
eukprot:scaffold62067_cov20-Tisochrysis_lutea.AAC.3